MTCIQTCTDNFSACSGSITTLCYQAVCDRTDWTLPPGNMTPRTKCRMALHHFGVMDGARHVWNNLHCWTCAIKTNLCKTYLPGTRFSPAVKNAHKERAQRHKDIAILGQQVSCTRGPSTRDQSIWNTSTLRAHITALGLTMNVELS